MGDVIVAHAPFIAQTSGSTQDVTSSRLGGLTPKAAIFLTGEPADGLSWGLGAADGTNQWWIAGGAEFNVSTQNSYSAANTNGCCAWYLQDQTAEARFSFNSWITNGVRINWDDWPAATRWVLCILFAGSDVSNAHAGVYDLGTTTGAKSDTAAGFQPDHVFTGFAKTTTTGLIQGMVRDIAFMRETVASAGDSVHLHQLVKDNVSRSDPVLIVNAQASSGTPEVAYIINESTDSIATTIGVASFLSSGVEWNVAGTAPNNEDIYYLALDLNGHPTKVGLFTASTASSSVDRTGIGFEPQLVISMATNSTTSGTVQTDANASTSGFGVTDSTTSSAQRVFSWTEEDNVAKSDNQTTIVTNRYVDSYVEGGANDGSAYISAFGSDGWTESWTLAGSAWYYGYVAFEKQTTTGAVLKDPIMRSGVVPFAR